MISRDNGLWLQFWRDRRTDFHQQAVNQLLTRFWPRLNPMVENRVFVPLCGKSLDMIWLTKQGHEVIGVELSPVAVKAFFRENGLQPTKIKRGPFTLWKHGKISILCGDFFSLTLNDLGPVDLVYDRAALTALPEDIRILYAAHMKQLLPETVKLFLLTAEDVDGTDNNHLAWEVDEEINTLFSGDFEVDLIHVESMAEDALPSAAKSPESIEYKVYFLSVK
ncbi:MAG: thiopurine S-methyltransferase [Methylomonas sp.]|jgi:thiopurine S-methyltransferase